MLGWTDDGVPPYVGLAGLQHFWGQAGGLQELFQFCQTALLFLKIIPGFVGDQAYSAAVRRQAAIGVVDAQVEAEFGSRGEHPIRFVGALRDQVVDQDGGVSFGAVQNQRRLLLYLQGGVDSCH